MQAGQAYLFKPNASDPEGQALRFSVQGLPAWAVLDTTTGTLSGTPDVTRVGTYSSIIVTVTDAGNASASLAPFSIEVIGNRPPTIGGVPAGNATVGQSYSFTPNASDPEGQKLTFSINSSKPGWAQFDAATGRLYGTPTDINVGTYSNIAISVSDGSNRTYLPTFSIAVQKPVSGIAELSWTPPTANVDGTPITNLAGYRVAYGQSASSLTQSIDIPSREITSATIENLSAGTWYFAVKAYTTSAVESELSNLAQKTIN